MQKVTGIGGVFFKAKDPKSLMSWYLEHLGLDFGEYGACTFRWINENPSQPGTTVFSLFPETSSHFNPSDKPFMINLRVKDLEALLEELKAKGVTIAGDIQVYEYGKFGWIVDPENNKIELWEPVDDPL